MGKKILFKVTKLNGLCSESNALDFFCISMSVFLLNFFCYDDDWPCLKNWMEVRVATRAS